MKRLRALDAAIANYLGQWFTLRNGTFVIRHARVEKTSARVLGSLMINALVISLSNIVICSVAAVLYVAVNEFEPNRRLASALRIVVVAAAVAAIFRHLMR